MSVSQTELQSVESGLNKALQSLGNQLTQDIAALSVAAGTADASTLLGLDFQANQYESRREALLNPTNYAKNRKTAFAAMKAAVNNKYADALKHYASAGMPPEMAKQFALQAASNESAIQQQVFELSFPSGANLIELNQQTAKIPGLGAAQTPRRRAPARRRRR